MNHPIINLLVFIMNYFQFLPFMIDVANQVQEGVHKSMPIRVCLSSATEKMIRCYFAEQCVICYIGQCGNELWSKATEHISDNIKVSISFWFASLITSWWRQTSFLYQLKMSSASIMDTHTQSYITTTPANISTDPNQAFSFYPILVFFFHPRLEKFEMILTNLNENKHILKWY